MKNLMILTAFLLTLTVGYGQSNVYHPFPVSNAFWGDDGSNIFNGSICYDTRYGLNGDTTINGKVYTKVYSLADSTLTNPNSNYFAAIREEDKRIYTLIGNFPEEVLYDFNLVVGDTINYHYSLVFNNTDEFARKVTKIDSVLLFNGEYRKQYTFAPVGFNSTDDLVVEGIGSILWKGLFNPLINAMATNGDNFRFECFKQNEIIYFLNNPDCDHCFCTLVTDIKDVKKLVNHTVTPNPFSQLAVLQTDYYLNNATLILYNSFGQVVRQLTSITGKTITLRRDNLPTGIYFYKLSENNRILASDKFIISKW